MADTKTTAAKAAGGKSSAKKQKTTIRKKKAKLGFTKGVAHIHASFNNTIVSISDPLDTLSLGPLLDPLDTLVLVNPLLLQLSLLHNKLPMLSWNVD